MTTSSRIVLNVALTGESTYTSGPLSVGDVTELLFDIDISAASGGTAEGNANDGYTRWYGILISRLSAFDTLVSAGALYYSNGPLSNVNVAAPAGPQALPIVTFGDRIQVDLLNPLGIELTGHLSLVGKG